MGEARRRSGASICRGCSMCCELFPVHALGKDAGTPCRHQCADGCGIHLDPGRPAVCGEFECRYLAFSRNRKPQHVRIPHPLDAGAFFFEEDARLFVVFVDPARPEFWKGTDVANYLNGFVAAGFAVVVVDRGYMMTLRAAGPWRDYLSRDCVAEAVAAGEAPNYLGKARAV